ncbi:MAG: hypothetical protein AAFU03_05285 [Bacteroidota bacterium]
MAKMNDDTGNNNPPDTDNGNEMLVEEMPTKTQKLINNYIETTLSSDIDQAHSAEKIGCLGYEEGKTSTQIRVCRLQDAQKVRGEYQGIHNCVSTTLAAHADGIQANVAIYLEKNTALEAKLTAALEAIKAAKSQMWKVREAACKLDAAREDSCNSEQLKALGELGSNEAGQRGNVRFDADVTAIRDEVFKLYNMSDELFEQGALFAGVQAFMNIPSLESMVAKLHEDAHGLASNVGENAGELDGLIADCQTELATEITSLTGGLFTKNSTRLDSLFLEQLNDDLSDLATEDCTAMDNNREADLEALNTICEEVMSTFSQEIDCGDGEPGMNKFNTPPAQ